MLHIDLEFIKKEPQAVLQHTVAKILTSWDGHRDIVQVFYL